MDWNNINTDKDTSGLGPFEYDQSKVPALIRQYADYVRTKTYGQEVREAQARNAEIAGLIASEAEIKASNADSLSRDTQNRFDDQIAGTTNSDEVIDARRRFGSETTFGTLGERLDYSENDLYSQRINAMYPPAPLMPLVHNADYYDPINFKYYTDESKTTPSFDNSSRLQAMVDFVGNKGGGTIYIPQGQFAFRSSVKWKTKVSLVGGGMENTFLFGEGRLFDLITALGYASDGSDYDIPEAWLEDFVMSDFTVDMKGLSSPYSDVNGKALFMLYLRRATLTRLFLKNTIGTALGCDLLPDTVINQVYTLNAGRNWGEPRSSTNSNPIEIGQSGIGIGTGALEWEPLTVTNCFTYGSGNFGIFVETQSNDKEGTHGKGAKIIGNHAEGNRVGIANIGSGETIISDNYVYKNRENGMEFTRGNSDNVQGNVITENGKHGIWFNGDYDGEALVANNIIKKNKGAGIWHNIIGLSSTNRQKNTNLNNNKIYENDRMGIYVGENHKENLLIKDNEIYNNGQNPAISTDRTGISIAGNNDVKILGNNVYDNQAASTQTVDLRIGEAVQYIVKDNTLESKVSSILSGDGVIENNIGLNNEVSGMATFESGSLYANVTHGLGVEPKLVVGFPIGKAEPIFFDGHVDNQRVSFKRADSTGTLDFYYYIVR